MSWMHYDQVMVTVFKAFTKFFILKFINPYLLMFESINLKSSLIY